MLPPEMAATNSFPSAEDATTYPIPVVCVQVAPESVEMKTVSPPAATNLVPSADEATEVQYLEGAPVCVQVTPELVEVQIEPPASDPPSTRAANLVPSADEAVQYHQ